MATKKKTTEEVVVTETKVATPKKPAAPRVKKIITVTVQFGGKEITTEEATTLAVAAWVAETGKKKTEAKDIKLYIKPEDSVIYYVINGESGSVEF